MKIMRPVFSLSVGTFFSSILISYEPNSGLLPDWIMYMVCGSFVGTLIYITQKYEALITELDELNKEEQQ